MLRVERHARNRHALVSDAAEQEPALERHSRAGPARRLLERAALEPVALEHDLGQPGVGPTLQLNGTQQEPQEHTPSRTADRPRHEALEDFEILLGDGAGPLFELRQACGIEGEVCGIHHRIAVRELAQLPKLLGRELGLCGPAPPDQMDLADAAFGQTVEGVLGDVGVLELVHRLRQDAAHVDRHVALADDGYDLLGEIEHAIPVVGMGVVPTDELGGRVAPRQVLARDAEPAIGFGSAAEQDGVISRPQVVDADVATDRDVAEQLEPGSAGDPLVNPNGLLELLMVRSDAVAHEAERGGQPLEHVHLNIAPRLEQSLGGVERAWPGADDRDPKGMTQKPSAAWRASARSASSKMALTGHTVTQSVNRHPLQLPVTIVGMRLSPLAP